MSIDNLTPEEDAILMGLARIVVQADHDYSDAEREQVVGLRNELGESRFVAAIEDARVRYGELTALKQAAKTILDAEKRRAIFSRLERLAECDGVTESEDKPLRWLASWWELSHD